MKCTIPEISWHNRDPVLSVDVQPILNNEFYRLASGGTDSHVLIWHLKILENGATSVEPVCDLTRHQRAVNVVRWSPSGQYLASGDDDANIIIWQQKADALSEMLDGESQDKEKWSVFKILRGHKEDVYDLSWSPSSQKLLTGSVDNTAIIWDLNKGTNDNILTDHKGFVQGVSWDPQGDFLATLSSDRICRIFNETGKQVKSRMSKGLLNLPESHPLHGQVVRYYHDDTLKSFFRRLTFSPDGNLLITPAGCLDVGQKHMYTTYIYSASSFSQPVAILPSPNQYTIAVRCCPILFELRQDGPEPAISLPYRMVIAVATRSSVLLYDTQQLTPFAVISNIHYTRLTDLTWSQDGLILAVSSTDGFCSLVTFDRNELGTEYIKEENEIMENENIENMETEEIKPVEIIIDEKIESKKEEKKRPSFLKQWATKNIDNNTEKEKTLNAMKEKDTNIIIIDDSPVKNTCESRPTNLKDVKRDLNSTTVAKPIEVRRKPREIEGTTQESVSVAKPIEVRRKPKDTNEAKPIEVRKKPREVVKISTVSSERSTEVDKSLDINKTKASHPSTEVTKTKDDLSKDVKSTVDEHADVTEHDIKTTNTKDINTSNTPKKSTNNSIEISSQTKNSPCSETKVLVGRKKTKETDTTNQNLSKSTNNSNSATKSNSGRKKLKDQMDITKFFTTTGEPPAKKQATENKSRVSLFTNNKVEDKEIIEVQEVAQDAWSSKIPETVVQNDFIAIEDSQDIKLVVEETMKESCSIPLDNFEKFHESQTNNENCSNNGLKTETEKISTEDKQNDPCTTSNKAETISEPITEDKSVVGQEKNTVTDIKTKINQLHLQSPVHKKKVPFITLSSPKNKKHKS